MAPTSYDLAVIGHFSIDTIVLPTRKSPFIVLGGPVTYTSSTAKNLGACACAISKVGASFPQAYLWWLEQEGINITNVIRRPDEATTGFELTYSHDFEVRTLKLKNKGTELKTEDIPTDFHAKAIHLGPITNEITYEVAEQIKKSGDILSLDPQGLTRSFDKEGNVLENATSFDSRIFSLIDVYKSSKNEIHTLTGESELKHAIKAIHDIGVKTVIVTMSDRGAILSVEGTQYNIGVYPPNVRVDPTGAGDAFIGAFLTEYLQGKEPLWCATVGSAAASLVIEGIGPTYFGKKEEIYQRANILYEKELKQ